MRRRGFRPQGIQPSAQHKVNVAEITTNPEAHAEVVEEMAKEIAVKPTTPKKPTKRTTKKKEAIASKVMKAVKDAFK